MTTTSTILYADILGEAVHRMHIRVATKEKCWASSLHEVFPAGIQVLGWIICATFFTVVVCDGANSAIALCLGLFSVFVRLSFSFPAQDQILIVNKQENVTSSLGCRTGFSK